MKQVFKFIAYFLSTSAAIGVIWGIAVYFNNKDNKDQVTDTQIEVVIQRLDKIDAKQIETGSKVDLLIEQGDDLSNKLDETIEAQNALRNSYVKYLTNDEALTKDEFLRYMDGVQFELKKKNVSGSLMTQSEQSPFLTPLSLK